MEPEDVDDIAEMIPGTFTVSFESLTDTDTWADPVDVEYVEKRPARSSDRMMAEGGVRVTIARFHFWTKWLDGVEPKPGDRFTDDKGVKWTIQNADEEQAGRRWATVCIKNR